MAACYNKDHQTPSSTCCQSDAMEEKLKMLEKLSAEFSCQQHMLVEEWVNEQKKKNKADKEEQIPFENVARVNKVIEATINAWEKFKSGSVVEIARGVLNIIPSLVELRSLPYGLAIKTLCSVISTILTYNKPKQPSVVEQLAEVVHGELANFNKKLNDQKYDGIRRRVSDQAAQLRTMKPGEKLDDPNLWNIYVQFMGELSNRFESPLPFKYDKGSLSKDPDVADFVTAVVTYCHAYSCFMALLMAAKGKFSELGGEYKLDEEVVDRKIKCQKEDAVQKLAFFSDENNLTFLGRLPYGGGKLTKILVLSRKLKAKSMVEVVRGSLNMSRMPELAKVESAAEKVSRQSVKLKLQGKRHQVPPGNLLMWLLSSLGGPPFWVQFVNETGFPMKVVSGTVGSSNSILKFVQNIEPHSSHARCVDTTFSTGGYLTIYLNGTLNAEIEPPAEDTRVIEFALSHPIFWDKINVQEKTSNEFTRGQDTYNAMKSGEAKTLYWFDRQQHYMAKAEIVYSTIRVVIWRFVVQDFDPLTVED